MAGQEAVSSTDTREIDYTPQAHVVHASNMFSEQSKQMLNEMDSQSELVLLKTIAQVVHVSEIHQ